MLFSVRSVTRTNFVMRQRSELGDKMIKIDVYMRPPRSIENVEEFLA